MLREMLRKLSMTGEAAFPLCLFLQLMPTHTGRWERRAEVPHAESMGNMKAALLALMLRRR